MKKKNQQEKTNKQATSYVMQISSSEDVLLKSFLEKTFIATYPINVP